MNIRARIISRFSETRGPVSIQPPEARLALEEEGGGRERERCREIFGCGAAETDAFLRLSPQNFGIIPSVIPAFLGSFCDRSCCTADLALSHKPRRATWATQKGAGG